jgi:hypothetical protein
VADSRIVVRRVGRETLLVPVSSGVGDLDSIYMLTDVGSTIWALLAQPTAPASIVDAVCAEFDVTREVAARDVHEFLDALASKKLIRRAPDGTA